MLDLDTKGSKTELLVKLKKHLKVRKADLGSVPPCVPGFAARPALAKSPVTGMKSPASMTNSKVTTTSLKTNLCICPICDDLIEEQSETTHGHDAIIVMALVTPGYIVDVLAYRSQLFYMPPNLTLNFSTPTAISTIKSLKSHL